MRAWTSTAEPSRRPSARRSATSRERAIAGGAIARQANDAAPGGAFLACRDQRPEAPGSRAPVARAPPLLIRLVGAEGDAREDRHAAEQLVGGDDLAEADPADRDADERLEVQERARGVGRDVRLPVSEQPERE